ncbi:hypothetical protein ABK046_45245, partial [Streptomyces caeruleatus]
MTIILILAGARHRLGRRPPRRRTRAATPNGLNTLPRLVAILLQNSPLFVAYRARMPPSCQITRAR